MPIMIILSCSLGNSRELTDLRFSAECRQGRVKCPHLIHWKLERETICLKLTASLRLGWQQGLPGCIHMYISIFLRTRGSERGSKLPKITLVLAEWYEVQLRFSRLLSLQLVKTAHLDPSRNYLAGFHPHGVLATGAFTNLCTESTGFSSSEAVYFSNVFVSLNNFICG